MEKKEAPNNTKDAILQRAAENKPMNMTGIDLANYYVGVMVVQGFETRNVVKNFPNYVRMSLLDAKKCKISIGSMTDYCKSQLVIAKEDAHPVEKLDAIASVSSLLVLPQSITYSSDEGPVNMPLTLGMPGSPDEISRALIADRYSYVQHRKKDAVHLPFQVAHAPLDTPSITMPIEPTIEGILNPLELRARTFEALSDPMVKVLIDNEVSRNFPKKHTKPYNAKACTAFREFYNTKIEPVTMVYGNTVPVRNVDNEVTMWKTIKKHRDVRGTEKGHGKMSIGYYLFSCSRTIEYTLAMTADLHYILSKAKLPRLIVNNFDKVMTRNIARSLILNEVQVQDLSLLTPQLDTSDILSYQVKEIPGVLFNTRCYWNDSAVSKKHNVISLTNSISQEAIEETLKVMVQGSGSHIKIWYLPYVTAMESYSGHIWYSTEADRAYVWFCNEKIFDEFNYRGFYGRTVKANFYKTYYPFFRNVFYPNDVFANPIFKAGAIRLNCVTMMAKALDTYGEIEEEKVRNVVVDQKVLTKQENYNYSITTKSEVKEIAPIAAPQSEKVKTDTKTAEQKRKKYNFEDDTVLGVQKTQEEEKAKMEGKLPSRPKKERLKDPDEESKPEKPEKPTKSDSSSEDPPKTNKPKYRQKTDTSPSTDTSSQSQSSGRGRHNNRNRRRGK